MILIIAITLMQVKYFNHRSERLKASHTGYGQHLHFNK